MLGESYQRALNHDYNTEIYRSEPSRRRECVYYLALGYYKLKLFEEAKKFNGMSPKFCLYLFIVCIHPTFLLAQYVSNRLDFNVCVCSTLLTPACRIVAGKGAKQPTSSVIGQVDRRADGPRYVFRITPQ